MKHKIFSIYDEKAQAFFPPFFMPKKGMAMREFMNLVIDKGSSIAQHPYDYTLFYIGTFDDSNAELLYKSQKECLGNGLEFKNQEIDGITPPEPMITPPVPMEKFIDKTTTYEDKKYDLAASAQKLTESNKTETPQI